MFIDWECCGNFSVGMGGVRMDKGMISCGSGIVLCVELKSSAEYVIENENENEK